MMNSRLSADEVPIGGSGDGGRLHIGLLEIDTALRRFHGPGGNGSIEPRVLDVLSTLAEAAGMLVTRQRLIERCWGGRVVGDDAVNRVIGEIRRLARSAAADSFVVETIPKAGWRLVETAGHAPSVAFGHLGVSAADTSEPSQPGPAPVTGVPDPVHAPGGRRGGRRFAVARLAGLGVVGAAGLVGAAMWRSRIDQHAQKVGGLVDEAARALRLGLPDAVNQGRGLLEEAVRLAPGHARAWGHLALAWRAAVDHGPAAETAVAVAGCENAFAKALTLDPGQPEALAARALLIPEFGDWERAEAALREVLVRAPTQPDAVSGLAVVLKSAGRDTDSAVFAKRAAELEPLSPVYQFRRAMALWTEGDLKEADHTLDRALHLWPTHPAVWTTRFLLYALSGRASAAQRLLDDREARPAGLSGPFADLLATTLNALDGGEPAAKERAIQAYADLLQQRGPSFAITAVLYLPALGALNLAFDAVNGYLLRTGLQVGALRRGNDEPRINDHHRRKTMMLFVPPTQAMRADGRFLPLCDGIGLTAYWRRCGVTPDFLRGNGSLTALLPRRP